MILAAWSTFFFSVAGVAAAIVAIFALLTLLWKIPIIKRPTHYVWRSITGTASGFIAENLDAAFQRNINGSLGHIQDDIRAINVRLEEGNRQFEEHDTRLSKLEETQIYQRGLIEGMSKSSD